MMIDLPPPPLADIWQLGQQPVIPIECVLEGRPLACPIRDREPPEHEDDFEPEIAVSSAANLTAQHGWPLDFTASKVGGSGDIPTVTVYGDAWRAVQPEPGEVFVLYAPLM